MAIKLCIIIKVKMLETTADHVLPGISRQFQVMVTVKMPTSTGVYVTLRRPSCSRSMLHRHTVFGPSTHRHRHFIAVSDLTSIIIISIIIHIIIIIIKTPSRL